MPRNLTAGERAIVDVRVRALVMREVRRRALTRVFGVPRSEQSPLVTLILLGAAAGLLRRPIARPSRAGTAMGAAVVNTAVRGAVGRDVSAVPFAGALIAFAVVTHSLRPTVIGVAHELRLAGHQFKRALGIRQR